MAQNPTTNRPAPKKVLIVDDEPLVANTIRMLLTIDGHEGQIVPDAENALTVFAPGLYDLVITDLTLPKMDGLDLARAIKERSPTQPVILVTAYAESLKEDSDRLASIDALLGKPFSVEQMREVLAKIFSASR